MLQMPSTKLPKNIMVNQDDIKILTGLSWNNIKNEVDGDDGRSTLYMVVVFDDEKLNYISEGINFTIQLLQDTYYQPHMFIASSLQNVGLGPKILKSFIMDYGHIYVGEGRTVNTHAQSMINKLANDPDFESYSDDIGIIIMKKGNEDREKLINIINLS
jgi:hypothetical protein